MLTRLRSFCLLRKNLQAMKNNKMGAGQIGGIATLVDIDFQNAAGFIGQKSEITEAQYIVYFLSHAMMFCVGSLIEAHVVLAPASCVYGETHKFEVFGGTHQFLEHSGIGRLVEHLGIHRGYNDTLRWESCTADNMALLLLSQQFYFHKREAGTEYIMNRIRYGAITKEQAKSASMNCKFYGWGSRRNGYMVPLLIYLRRVDVTILNQENCLQMWNYGEKYLCIQQFPCRSSKHGALCPDDLGTVIECSGFLRGMMTSRLIDRPCGVGYLDMNKYLKFLTCGVDDSRDILGHDDFIEFEFESTTITHPTLPSIVTPPHQNVTFEVDDDPGPPKADPSTYDDEEVTEVTAASPS
ncbi:uncharacterized protein LOC126377011 isoform X5 [Pectinophora gossypiella]|uniref:uncharacterized protein LOC126377011 isoform X5 n=1 Tax=Pectinophora gossypiella TaxID=13191 RepID=UPI00214EA7F3|nr:uncharacterized protein LOC126377011 isoform X5 [Pectinophora gossypiella]